MYIFPWKAFSICHKVHVGVIVKGSPSMVNETEVANCYVVF